MTKPSWNQVWAGIRSLGIGIGGIVTVLGLLKGAIEVNNLVKTTEQRRMTLRYLDSLAMQSIENGEYTLAQKYVDRAAAIDPSTYQVARSRAVIDSLTAYQDQLKANLAPSRYLIYKLQSLGLSDPESRFCIAMAQRREALDDAAKMLADVADHATGKRLRALAKYEIAASVLAPRLKQHLTSDDLKLMRSRLQDALKELGTDDNVVRQGALFSFMMSEPDTLDALLAKAMREEIVDYIRKVDDLSAALVAPTPAKSAEKLAVIAATEPVDSPIAIAAQKQATQIATSADEQRAPAAPAGSPLREALSLKSQGRYDDAAAKLTEVAEKSPDEFTQYRAHFSLALLYEYQKHQPDRAEAEYLEAYKHHDAAAKSDPSLPNTLGYFYYNRAVDARTSGERKAALTNAKKYLTEASRLGSRKASNTLDAVNEMLEREQAPKQAAAE